MLSKFLTTYPPLVDIGDRITHGRLYITLLKFSRNKKDLNDVTAAPFWVVFFDAGSWEKDIKTGAAVTSLKSFLFCDNSSSVYASYKFHGNIFM